MSDITKCDDCAYETAEVTLPVAPERFAPVQFPLKLMRISPISPYFHRARLVLSADCAAFSYERFREICSTNSTLVIGCPDGFGEDFKKKLEQILTLNEIQSIMLVRMDANCCRRMTDAVIRAIRSAKRDIPLRITTLFTEGEIVE